jgi:K+-transporting ATPase ATPase A chain
MHIFSIDWLQILLFALLTAILIPILGNFWANLAQGKRTVLHPILSWLENLSYQIAGVDSAKEMSWKQYAKSFFVFTVIGTFLLFLILILQSYLPLNPQKFPGLSWDQALNIAVSFATNTDWQSYAGESTLSYTSQMLGLTVQNFLSASAGSAILMAMIRGITRQAADTIGNFWVDLVRSVVYLFLPLSFALALALVGQGVVQTFSDYQRIETLEGTNQIIPLGPVASQVSIKILGNNGGGFFNANSAHPFENPTPLSNLLEVVFMLALPISLLYSYGLLIGSTKHAFLLLAIRIILFFLIFAIAFYLESMVNPVLEAYPLLEGKEVRFGNINSVFWATVATSTSAGSINTMHESLSPLTGGIVLFNILLGEVVFGGIGVGVCILIFYVLLTAFLSGLMVGRTPEYRGKKIGKTDIQWIVIAVTAPSVLILLGAGISSVIPQALLSLSTFGPHGLTELIYAFASATMNNGSAFEGIDPNTMYLNLVLALVIWLGRLAVVIPSLAIAGSFAAKTSVPESTATLSTNTLLFGILLLCVIVILGGLAFFPVMALGPIVEQMLMLQGQSYPFTGGTI